MRAVFRFAAAAWAIPEARHAIETIASLLDVPSRMEVAHEGAASSAATDAIVFVGAPGTALADAAAIVDVDGWPVWDAATLVRKEIAGEPLPCPPATPESGSDVPAFPPAWLRAAGALLAREEELQTERRDQWECFAGDMSRLDAIGLLDRPMIDHLARALARRLDAHAARVGAQLERRPRWKDGKTFAVALSHDVDDITLRSWSMSWRLLRQSRSPRSYAFRAGLTAAARALARRPGEIDPYWAFDRWMSEEERHGFRSTFFVCPPTPSRRHEYDPLYRMDDRLGYDGRRVSLAQLLGAMRERGHEVGLHGSYMSHREAAELSRQREQIAAGAGAAPSGIRQHFLRFDVRTTWAAQARAGFVYDSTLGYNERIGFRAGIAAPFRPWNPEARRPHDLWEIPLTAMDGALFRVAKLEVAAALDQVRKQLDVVAEVGGLAVLLWHPNAADRVRFPGWWDCYIGVLEELSRRPAWVATTGEIHAWWASRVTSASPDVKSV
jgi:peptidoglycan/xylan/chitin deacetylase (PgdA/CDA1 family)